MRAIDLREYARSEPYPLTVAERDGLKGILPSVVIEPAPGLEGAYCLTPGSIVGAFESGGLSVSIRPKLAIVRVLLLAAYAARLDNVSLVEFSANAVPEVTFDRLTEHYREVVTLARLILRHTAFDAARGGIRAPGFLIDMNQMFQDFVTQALREALRVSQRVFRSDNAIPSVTLDEAGRVPLKPDLSWWEAGTCSFVGDVKYKRIADERVPNADLYQLLAYATALDLPGGLLIYAQGEAEPTAHRVRHAGKRLEVAALDLSGSQDELLARIDELAHRVRALRHAARGTRHAA